MLRQRIEALSVRRVRALMTGWTEGNRQSYGDHGLGVGYTSGAERTDIRGNLSVIRVGNQPMTREMIDALQRQIVSAPPNGGISSLWRGVPDQVNAFLLSLAAVEMRASDLLAAGRFGFVTSAKKPLASPTVGDIVGCYSGDDAGMPLPPTAQAEIMREREARFQHDLTTNLALTAPQFLILGEDLAARVIPAGTEPTPLLLAAFQRLLEPTDRWMTGMAFKEGTLKMQSLAELPGVVEQISGLITELGNVRIMPA